MRFGCIRNKLILASLILTVPFVVWNAAVQVLRFRESRAAAITELQKATGHVADACAAWVRSVTDLERTAGFMLWECDEAQKNDVSMCLKRMTGSNPAIRHLAVSDMRGIVFASDLRRLIGADFSRYPFVRKVMGGADWAVSNLLPGGLGVKSVFGVAVKIKDEHGKPLGLLIALMDEDNLKKILHHDIARAGCVAIIDSHGAATLTRGFPESVRSRIRWSKLPFIRQALTGNPAVIENYRMPDGEVMLGAAVPVKELGWAATVFTPRDKVIAPALRDAIAHMLVVFVIAGAVIGMAILIGNRTAKSVMDLAQTARSFGGGNLGARTDVNTGDELEFLGTSFNEMAGELQERTSQLNITLESQRRQSERLSALYTMAQGLVVTMTLDDRLEVIAHTLASICGFKRCVIFLRRGDRLTGAAGWGLIHPESLAGLVFEIGRPAWPATDTLVDGSPIIVQDVMTDPRMGTEFANMLAGLSVNGFVALPLVRKKHLVGLAVLDNPGESPRYDSECMDVARGLADLASIAVENAQAFEKERNIAQALQGSLLPTVPEKIGNFSFASGYYPAIEMAELGGDFYDLMILPDGRVAIFIADVSGKGLEAAIFTAMGKYTLRAFISESPFPGSALTRANKALSMTGTDWGFVTMFYGLLDTRTGRLTYASAGHPPCILAHADGRTLTLPVSESQPPLGVFHPIEYIEHEYQMSEGEVLAGYTDGVIEARHDNEQFEIGRLAEVVAGSRHLPPEEIADSIHKAVVDFTRGRIQDDIALLIIKYEKSDTA